MRHRFVFLEDYDIAVARALYQGADVWLNNPRRPQEACGTSGMKAALNGALNCSILDGWWDEMFDGENGWAITSAEGLETTSAATRPRPTASSSCSSARSCPLFYERRGTAPRGWLRPGEARASPPSARRSPPAAWCATTSSSSTSRPPPTTRALAGADGASSRPGAGGLEGAGARRLARRARRRRRSSTPGPPTSATTRTVAADGRARRPHARRRRGAARAGLRRRRRRARRHRGRRRWPPAATPPTATSATRGLLRLRAGRPPGRHRAGRAVAPAARHPGRARAASPGPETSRRRRAARAAFWRRVTLRTMAMATTAATAAEDAPTAPSWSDERNSSRSTVSSASVLKPKRPEENPIRACEDPQHPPAPRGSRAPGPDRAGRRDRTPWPTGPAGAGRARGWPRG